MVDVWAHRSVPKRPPSRVAGNTRSDLLGLSGGGRRALGGFRAGAFAGHSSCSFPRPLVREDEVREPDDAPVHLDVLTFAGI
jgi:hypothetical protein